MVALGLRLDLLHELARFRDELGLFSLVTEDIGLPLVIEELDDRFFFSRALPDIADNADPLVALLFAANSIGSDLARGSGAGRGGRGRGA